MIPMSPLTCADKEIVPQAGEDVQVNQTIVAYLNGSSAMERTIVVTTAMNFPKIAQHVKLNLTSSAKIIAAYPNNGLG